MAERDVEYRIKATADFREVKTELYRLERHMERILQNKKTKIKIDAVDTSSVRNAGAKAGSMFNSEFLAKLAGGGIPTAMKGVGVKSIQAFGSGASGAGAALGPVGLGIGAALGGAVIAGFAAVRVTETIINIAKSVYSTLASLNAAYMQNVKGSVLLTGATRQVNGEFARQQEIVNDTTKSYEERANALGIDSDKIYESTSAVGASVRVNDDLGESIKRTQAEIRNRSYETEREIKVLGRQLDVEQDLLAQQKTKNEAALKARKDALGFSTITNTNTGLSSQITALEIRKKELQLQGDFTFEIDEQLTRLKLEKNLNDDKLEQIDQQTEGFKEQGQALEDSIVDRIKDIENRISQGKLKIEIDTADAQSKLEELQYQMSQLTTPTVSGGGGGGSTQIVKQSVKDLIDAQKNELSRSFTDEDVKNLSLRLQERYGKYLTLPTINKSIANLLKGGADLSQAEDIFMNYADAAASGKRESISFAKAMDNLTEAYAINSPTIGQYSGVTENLISQVIPKGIDILKQQYLAQGRVNDATRVGSGVLTDAERDLAKYEGTMFYTNDTQGTFNDLAEAGTLNIDSLNASLFNMQVLLGDLTSTGFAKMLGVLSDSINWFIEYETRTNAIRGALAALGQKFDETFTDEDIETIKTVAKFFGEVLVFAIQLAVREMGNLLDETKEFIDQAKWIHDNALMPATRAAAPLLPGLLPFAAPYLAPLARRSEGGIVRGPGTSTSDSIPALLSDNEYVIKASIVEKFGKSFFDKINSGGNVTNTENSNTKNTENNYYYNQKGYRFANV